MHWSDQCEQVRESVSDKRLQALIEQILNDPNPLQAVKDILQSNPDFAEFGDLCLRTIGIRDDSGNCLLWTPSPAPLQHSQPRWIIHIQVSSTSERIKCKLAQGGIAILFLLSAWQTLLLRNLSKRTNSSCSLFWSVYLLWMCCTWCWTFRVCSCGILSLSGTTWAGVLLFWLLWVVMWCSECLQNVGMKETLWLVLGRIWEAEDCWAMCLICFVSLLSFSFSLASLIMLGTSYLL